ncbi:hypothetical protein V8F33_013416 [Rhypophila sp. PSN 637]
MLKQVKRRSCSFFLMLFLVLVFLSIEGKSKCVTPAVCKKESKKLSKAEIDIADSDDSLAKQVLDGKSYLQGGGCLSIRGGRRPSPVQVVVSSFLYLVETSVSTRCTCVKRSPGPVWLGTKENKGV